MSDLSDSMPVLPQNVEPYKKTIVFDEKTVPDGLQHNHSTKAGTWGVLHIVSGGLRYHITEPGSEASFGLDSERVGIIKSQQVHHIELVGQVEFYIEFCREITKA